MIIREIKLYSNYLKIDLDTALKVTLGLTNAFSSTFLFSVDGFI